MSTSSKKYARNKEKMRRDKLDEFGYWFCDKCKMNNAYQMQIHHIVFRSEKPQHKHLHDRKNLIDLCQKCHMDFHDDKSSRNYLIEERGLLELFGQDILRYTARN